MCLLSVHLLQCRSILSPSGEQAFTFVYLNFFFIIHRVKARAIPCPHQPPTRDDNTVSVAQGGTATPGATKQLLPPDRVLRESYIYIYIYTPDQLDAVTKLDVNIHFLGAVCDLKKNAFTFGGWCYYAFTVTVSYVITRERWFRVYFLHAENFLAFDHMQLDAYRPVVWRRFEATFKLRPVIPIFVYLYCIKSINY